MKKTSAYTIILTVISFILLFLLVENFQDALSAPIFDPMTILASFIFAIFTPLFIGFVLAVPFILFIKKENLKRTLNYILYFSLLFVILLFIYHLFEKYTDVFKNFYGFTDLAEFMYKFRYDKSPLFWTAIVQFCIDTLTFFLFAVNLWISFIVGFILHINSEIHKIEK